MYPVDWEYYYYVHDASGNPMAIYQSKFTESNSLQSSRGLYATEFPIYGQSRLGIYTPKSNSPHGKLSQTLTNYSNGSTHSLYNSFQPQNIAKTIYFGEKSYEISDYLGNITAVLSDKGLYLDNDTMQKVALSSSQDYYPGGSIMPGRNYSSESYRYGYNKGSEKDDEIAGIGNSFTTKYRQGDTRTLRWWSVDPKANQMPWQSPYSYMDGNPVRYNDPDGDCPSCLLSLKAAYYAYKAKYSQMFGIATKPALRLASGTSGNVPDHVNMNSQARSMNSFTGSVGDASAVAKVGGELAAESLKDVGGGVDELGEVISDGALLAAPFTGGTSLSLLPVGSGISSVGKSIKTAGLLISGDESGAESNLIEIGVSTLINKSISSVIIKSKQVGSIVNKTEEAIQRTGLEAVGSASERVVKEIINKSENEK